MRHSIGCLVLFITMALIGCEKSDEKTKPPASSPTGSKPVAEHKPGNGDGSGSHGGEVIELGIAKVGDSKVRASRDKGEIKPGGDAPIDVWIDGGLGTGVTAVRFWIGAQDATGSVKAKAEVEDGKWHAHAEVPDPLPPGSKLWVEIENQDGKKSVASFDLKT